MNANLEALDRILKAVKSGKTVEVKHYGKTAFIRKIADPKGDWAAISDKMNSGASFGVDLAPVGRYDADDDRNPAGYLADNGIKAKY